MIIRLYIDTVAVWSNGGANIQVLIRFVCIQFTMYFNSEYLLIFYEVSKYKIVMLLWQISGMRLQIPPHVSNCYLFMVNAINRTVSNTYIDRHQSWTTSLWFTFVALICLRKVYSYTCIILHSYLKRQSTKLYQRMRCVNVGRLTSSVYFVTTDIKMYSVIQMKIIQN